MENKIIINWKEYTLKTIGENDECFLGYWNGDDLAETETCLLLSGPGTMEEVNRDLSERLEENKIKPGIDNKQYLWSELSEEEKQKLYNECLETGKKVKEKYPSPSIEAYRYWQSISSEYLRKRLTYFKKILLWLGK